VIGTGFRIQDFFNGVVFFDDIFFQRLPAAFGVLPFRYKFRVLILNVRGGKSIKKEG